MASTDTTDLRRRLATTRQGIRRAVLSQRRLLCALCLAGAVLAGLRAVAPTPPPTVSVAVAAHDLPAGSTITADDLTTVELPVGSAPDHASDTAYALGRTVAGPVRRGEPVTDVRLVGATMLQGYPGMVAVPVRIPDDAAAALLRTGDRIDLLATDQRTGETELVGDDVPVIALPRPSGPTQGFGSRGRLIVVATTSEMSEDVAAAAATLYLTATISR